MTQSDSSRVTSWWLIRHGPVINPSGAIYGQQDVALDTRDADIFTRVGMHLPADALWFASPLSRTTQTAQRLGGKNITPLPELIEQHFGDWQGHHAQKVDKAESHPFWECPAYLRPPGGESFTDVAARVAPTLETLSQQHAGKNIVCVAHGGSIRAALAMAASIPLDLALAFRIDTLSVTRLDYITFPPSDARRQWRINGVNQTYPPSHG